jgi:CheY-like chemotaxis protein
LPKLLRIALVEDNPVDVFFFQIALEDSGIPCDLVAYDSTAKLLAALPCERQFDVIVTEWFQRSCDVPRLFSEIRALPEHAHTPIVIACAFRDAPPAARAAGAFHYLTKAIDPPQIVALLNKLLNRRAAYC